MNLMETLRTDLQNKKYQRIVVLSGAGVSVNAGIPDYRSRTGIFQELVDSKDFAEFNAPEDLFSRAFANRYPNFEQHPIMQQFRERMSAAEPTASHHFVKCLSDQGLLSRLYTQNVDGLYRKAGVPREKAVEYHGNYADNTVVRYGDPIPAHIESLVQSDFCGLNPPDLLIVMGSSLQVAPFCALPNMVSRDCTRVLVDIAPSNAFSNNWSKRASIRNGHVFYPSGAISSFKYAGRWVSLRPRWQDNEHFRNQLICKSDCDQWATFMMMTDNNTTEAK